MVNANSKPSRRPHFAKGMGRFSCTAKRYLSCVNDTHKNKSDAQHAQHCGTRTMHGQTGAGTPQHLVPPTLLSCADVQLIHVLVEEIDEAPVCIRHQFRDSTHRQVAGSVVRQQTGNVADGSGDPEGHVDGVHTSDGDNVRWPNDVGELDTTMFPVPTTATTTATATGTPLAQREQSKERHTGAWLTKGHALVNTHHERELVEEGHRGVDIRRRRQHRQCQLIQ